MIIIMSIIKKDMFIMLMQRQEKLLVEIDGMVQMNKLHN